MSKPELSYYNQDKPDAKRETFDLEISFKLEDKWCYARIGIVHEYKKKFEDQKRFNQRSFIEYLMDELSKKDHMTNGFIPYCNFECAYWWYVKHLNKNHTQEFK